MQKHDWMVLWWSIYGDMSMNGGGRPEEVDAEAGGEGVVGARSGVAVPSSWRGTARRGLSRRCRSSLSWASTRSWIEGEDVEETRSTLTKMIPPPPPPCYVTWVNHPKSSCKSYISPKSLFFFGLLLIKFWFCLGEVLSEKRIDSCASYGSRGCRGAGGSGLIRLLRTSSQPRTINGGITLLHVLKSSMFWILQMKFNNYQCWSQLDRQVRWKWIHCLAVVDILYYICFWWSIFVV